MDQGAYLSKEEVDKFNENSKNLRPQHYEDIPNLTPTSP